MNVTENVVGGVGKMTPLISFNTLYDMDVGLMRLVYFEYLSPQVFKEEFFTKPIVESISALYYRKERNPLVLASYDNVPREDLEDYYKQFVEQCGDKIADYSVGTDVRQMVSLFKVNNEIYPTILYYTEKQKQILESDDITKSIRMVSFEQLKANKQLSGFSQYYFRYFDEAEPFISGSNPKTFYFANCGPNLNDAQDDIGESSIVDAIVKGRNHLNFFNMYNEAIVKKGTRNE